MNYGNYGGYHPAATGAGSGIDLAFVLISFLIMLALFFFSIYLYWRIVSKAGFHGAWSLVVLVPVVNIVFFIIFAFIEWPIERKLKEAQSAQMSPKPMPVYPNTTQMPPQGM